MDTVQFSPGQSQQPNTENSSNADVFELLEVLGFEITSTTNVSVILENLSLADDKKTIIKSLDFFKEFIHTKDYCTAFDFVFNLQTKTKVQAFEQMLQVIFVIGRGSLYIPTKPDKQDFATISANPFIESLKIQLQKISLDKIPLPVWNVFFENTIDCVISANNFDQSTDDENDPDVYMETVPNYDFQKEAIPYILSIFSSNSDLSYLKGPLHRLIDHYINLSKTDYEIYESLMSSTPENLKQLMFAKIYQDKLSKLPFGVDKV